MSTAATEHELTLESLFVDAQFLPSPPVSVLEIVRQADDPDVDLHDIVKLIERDIALAVQILKMSNSALYSPVNEITTIDRAITTLGLRSIRLIALSTSLRTLIPPLGEVFDTSEIRRRMVINASLARKFAQSLAPLIQDEAFLAGLLTGLGPVVLAARAPEVCRQLFGNDNTWPTSEAEQELLGFTLNDITSNLVQKWSLPVVLCEAVEHRADPLDPGDSPLLRCMKLSLLAERVLCGPDSGTALGLLNEMNATELGMSADATKEWLIEAEPLVATNADLLRLQFPQAEAYSELLVEATARMQALTLEAHETIIQGTREVEALSQRNTELMHEASTDALTQLPNRGVFDKTLAGRVSECRGHRSSDRRLGLLILDLDHFKLVNDTYGHLVGDDVLRSLGALLRRQTRGDDFAARYGGEEFIVLIPQTTPTELALIAERLRTAVEDLAFDMPDGLRFGVTVSIGGALLRESAALDSGRALVECADSRLYAAKEQGRNCVVLS